MISLYVSRQISFRGPQYMVLANGLRRRDCYIWTRREPVANIAIAFSAERKEEKAVSLFASSSSSPFTLSASLGGRMTKGGIEDRTYPFHTHWPFLSVAVEEVGNSLKWEQMD